MKELYLNLRHMARCPYKGCLLCKQIPYEWYKESERDWKWYIIIAWAMFEYAILHG